MEIFDMRKLVGPPQIAEKIGYPWTQRKSQRRLGPIPEWTDILPKGCEVFVRNIPRDGNEDDLFPIFASVGIIYEMRLTMDPYGLNRGYGFVRYMSREFAQRAVQELNGYQIADGRRLRVVFSVDNSRLFVGGIPRVATREDILHTFRCLVPGVKDVCMHRDYRRRELNRGFAFLEFRSHDLAAAARRIIMPYPYTALGRLTVDWALPEVPVSLEVLKRIKTLHVRNLLLETSSFTLTEIFKSVIHPNCFHIKKCYDYAFVCFTKREDAERAMLMLQDALVDGVNIKIEWAKPSEDRLKRWRVNQREKLKKKPKSRKGSIEELTTSGQNLQSRQSTENVQTRDNPCYLPPSVSSVIPHYFPYSMYFQYYPHQFYAYPIYLPSLYTNIFSQTVFYINNTRTTNDQREGVSITEITDEDLPEENEEGSVLEGDVTSTEESSALTRYDCNLNATDQEENLRGICERYGWPQPVYHDVVSTEQRWTYTSTVMITIGTPFVPQTLSFHSGECMEVTEARSRAAFLALNYLNVSYL